SDKEFEKLKPMQVETLDEILGQPFNVLDDGFVRVVDYMGSDQSIVQAARVSYGAGTKKVSQDRGLIRYLMRHHHSTPFEMCEIKLHVRVPMDAWRQWIRHRTANVNEYSTRYSIAIDQAVKTDEKEWRIQSTSNKQGSDGFLAHEEGKILSEEEKNLHNNLWDIYNRRIEKGVAREQARKDLPLSVYTEAYWKIDLHNLFHFLRLRMDKHAQLEIRNYATTIGHEIVKRWVPLAWEAFEDYRMNSKSFSGPEIELLGLISNNKNDEAINRAMEFGWIKYKEDRLLGNLERTEFEEKLDVLNLKKPW
ncbi:MAG: FAD-dependent thymidylate synthase, partial [Melioribacteraceae bacterium]|nr:FAD-dependent thymidylate synthase [Melioribacteraceae bacterium]